MTPDPLMALLSIFDDGHKSILYKSIRGYKSYKGFSPFFIAAHMVVAQNWKLVTANLMEKWYSLTGLVALVEKCTVLVK